MTPEMKIPSSDHPITIEPSPDRVIVRAGDATLADSTATLVLRESFALPGPDEDRRAIWHRLEA